MKLIIYIRNLVLYVVMICPHVQNAQSLKTKSDVKLLFPENTRDLWINYLSGTFDQKHVADMIIGTDGHSYKGIYTLRNSNTYFYFDGEEIQKQLKLVEVNEHSSPTGFMNGHYNGQSFEGNWTNCQKTISLPFNFTYVNSFEEFKPKHCDLLQWYQIFEGKIENKDIRLAIVKENDVFDCELLEDEKIYKNHTSAKADKVIKLDFKSEKNVLWNKKIYIDTSDMEKINVSTFDILGKEVLMPLKRTEKLLYDCYEYADYYSRMECIRPVSDNKKFNLWLENIFKSWLQSSIKKVKSVQTNEIGTKERWIQTANGWVEVDLFLKDLISGTIYMQSSWKKETDKISFIYDLNVGKELQLQDIFQNQFDSKAYFTLVVSGRKKEKKWIPEIKNWINTQNFGFATLKNEGISFKTEFNTLFGEKEILIPYKEFETSLKNKSLLKEISYRKWIPQNF